MVAYWGHIPTGWSDDRDGIEPGPQYAHGSGAPHRNLDDRRRPHELGLRQRPDRLDLGLLPGVARGARSGSTWVMVPLPHAEVIGSREVACHPGLRKARGRTVVARWDCAASAATRPWRPAPPPTRTEVQWSGSSAATIELPPMSPNTSARCSVVESTTELVLRLRRGVEQRVKRALKGWAVVQHEVILRPRRVYQRVGDPRV
jgi:hypothetical protein